MKAVVFDRTGGPEVLHIGEVETPVPGPRQVLIKTAYAGINFADIGGRTGLLTRRRCRSWLASRGRVRSRRPVRT